MQPRLRNLQPQWGEQNGQPVLVLRDPLSLCDKTLALPQPLAPLLAFCDGSRDESAIRAAMEIRAGVRIPPEILSQILEQLDAALLLENERSAAALQDALVSYRRAPFRPPALAGTSYPAEPDSLADLLQGYIGVVEHSVTSRHAKGLISPHIDFARGCEVYAQVWKAAEEAAQHAEIVVIFGTDHIGDFSPFTLTRQSYATPFGVLPTDAEAVQCIADVVGEDAAFRDELHHRVEHSVELAAVWLHYTRGGKPCSLVPILCGSFDPFVTGRERAQDSDRIKRGLESLRKVLDGRKALVVAAADLAHTGPAFGDAIAAGLVQRTNGKKADKALIQSICEGSADDFLGLIQHERDARHICGLPPIYLALRLLEPAHGHLIAYEQAAADAQGTSFVSFCGIILD